MTSHLDHEAEIKENLDAIRAKCLNAPGKSRNLFKVFSIGEIRQLAKERIDANEDPKQFTRHVQAGECLEIIKHYARGGSQFFIEAKNADDQLRLAALFAFAWARHLCVLIDDHIANLQDILDKTHDDAQLREKVAQLAKYALRVGGIQSQYDPTGALAVRQEMIYAQKAFADSAVKLGSLS